MAAGCWLEHLGAYLSNHIYGQDALGGAQKFTLLREAVGEVWLSDTAAEVINDAASCMQHLHPIEGTVYLQIYILVNYYLS